MFMKLKSYRVTCKKCGGSDVLKITDKNQVFYTEHTPIIAARFRPDLKWGFECMCGNDSRLAIEEKDQLGFLVKNASKQTVADIAKNLTKTNATRFKMETV